jgi:hypothetical protein
MIVRVGHVFELSRLDKSGTRVDEGKLESSSPRVILATRTRCHSVRVTHRRRQDYGNEKTEATEGSIEGRRGPLANSCINDTRAPSKQGAKTGPRVRHN